eukprot:TRINITY_DN2907_c0_g1_i1.p1 TRINITY_DN2907_c0_g1~~TRINITY_DN2907_c0_g1_i1.p1  ORF type:complete len:548 (-),score=121.95 TRINITY_DN2907_c0_g1_i1:86-1729(-)
MASNPSLVRSISTLSAFQRNTESTAASSIKSYLSAWAPDAEAQEAPGSPLLMPVPKAPEMSSNEHKKLYAQMQGFDHLYETWVLQKSLKPDYTLANVPQPLSLTDLKEESPITAKSLSELAVLKLTGGLALGMGTEQPKAIMEVLNNFTFLDLAVQHVSHLNENHNTNIPLLLMNSFYTDTNVRKVLPKYDNLKTEIIPFVQRRYPRIDKESLLPVASHLNSESALEWYPPGHGDVYDALYQSGHLENLLNQGKKYLFISNIDNLGASINIKILQHLQANPDIEMLIELTDKTPSDEGKGGALIEVDGQIRLLESEQVPVQQQPLFKSTQKFPHINTNNLWFSLPALHQAIKSGRSLAQPGDVVVKRSRSGVVGPAKEFEIEGDEKARSNLMGGVVLQLERAAGAAVSFYERKNIGIVNVPRSRFLPVKNTSDLLLVQSNLYDLKDGVLEVSDKREFKDVKYMPNVKLGESFVNVKEYEKRIKPTGTAIDMLECHHLTVIGDVWFGEGVKVKGTVIIVAAQGQRINIPPGAVLDNKIVTGNLRMTDH